MALDWLADLLLRLTRNHALGGLAADLLRQGAPGHAEARLDGQSELLQGHFDAIDAALCGLPHTARQRLATLRTPTQAYPATGEDAPFDALAITLLTGLAAWPDEARTLAVVLARLLEDSPRLHASRRSPLGRGFEHLLEERWQCRFALLPDHLDTLVVLQRHGRLLLEEPDEGRSAMARDLGRSLTEEEDAWLPLERRLATLRFLRQYKTEDGHIRWYVRRDSRHGTVLERLGVQGYWAVCGKGGPTVLARLGTAAERVLGTDATSSDSGWHTVWVGEETAAATLWLPAHLRGESDPLHLRAAVRRASPMTASGSAAARIPEFADLQMIQLPRVRRQADHRFELIGHEQHLSLHAASPERRREVIARVSCTGSDDEILDFLECVARVADLAMPVERLASDFDGGPALAWTRAWLRGLTADAPLRGGPCAGRRVRLVYLPSSIPHQLGGVPQVGASFLRDHLERLGARVDVIMLRRDEFERRLVELLGADAIGIGVYIHNREEVADLVRRLRAAGFAGKIILGGPETRNIEAVQEAIPDWDAIVRGEGEEVLPRVLAVFDYFERGDWEMGLTEARRLRGVTLRQGNIVLLCDTSTRNKAEAITCPLPFDWQRTTRQRRLKMNFTRGCPYRCSFCPNHQGRAFSSGPVEELWRFSVLAIADDLPLPSAVERRVARLIQQRFGVTGPPRLRLALHLLLRTPLTARHLEEVCVALASVVDGRLRSDEQQLASLIGLEETAMGRLHLLGDGPVSAWHGKEVWLLAKAEVLASRQLWRREARHLPILAALQRRAQPAFVLETSEDNTLVNRKQILAYLERRRLYGLADDFVFNPGQNTIQDLLQGHDREEANEDYIARLAEDNPFAVALGTDGPSNAILRQNQKPLYRIAGVLAVNKALGRYAREVANNYILVTPETNLLEAIESFVLFLLLPVPWRDYGEAINLRVITEETTLATDEGLLLQPDDEAYHVPLRFAEVQRLLDRWGLTSELPSDRLRPLLWRMLENDAEVTALLPLLVRRWEKNFDADPEIAALAKLVHVEWHGAESITHALWRLAERVHAEALVAGRTLATFRDLLHLQTATSPGEVANDSLPGRPVRQEP